MLIHKQDFYVILPSQDSGAVKKERKNQRFGKTRAEQYFLHMIGPLHA